MGAEPVESKLWYVSQSLSCLASVVVGVSGITLLGGRKLVLTCECILLTLRLLREIRHHVVIRLSSLDHEDAPQTHRPLAILLRQSPSNAFRKALSLALTSLHSDFQNIAR